MNKEYKQYLQTVVASINVNVQTLLQPEIKTQICWIFTLMFPYYRPYYGYILVAKLDALTCLVK